MITIYQECILHLYDERDSKHSRSFVSPSNDGLQKIKKKEDLNSNLKLLTDNEDQKSKSNKYLDKKSGYFIEDIKIH